MVGARLSGWRRPCYVALNDLSRPFMDGPDPMAASPAPLLTASPAPAAIAGRWDLPGDRAAGLGALACAALALGRSRVRGLADTVESRAFTASLRRLGVGIDRLQGGDLAVQGRGVGGLAEPAQTLDTGGSGAVAALLLGMAATLPFATTLNQCSLHDPLPAGLVGGLMRIGARLLLRSGGRLPGTLLGTDQPLPASHKAEGEWGRAALLLAGLNIPGRTSVRPGGAIPRMLAGLLAHFGAPSPTGPDGSSVTGPADLMARDLCLPGDADLAALALVAALGRPGGSLVLPRVALDRIGLSLIPALRALGADISLTGVGMQDGLAVADITLRPGGLTGAVIDLAALEPPGDDLPFLLVAAAQTPEPTRVTGMGAVRDRLDRMVPALAAAGIVVTEQGDGVMVTGGGPAGAAPIPVKGDMPLALALLARGCGGRHPLTLAGAAGLIERYPGLMAGFNGLGGAIRIDGQWPQPE